MPATSASVAVPAQYAPPLTPTALTRSSATTTMLVARGTSGETIERPLEYTLARGRYEAKPATIWIVAAVGALIALAWLLTRVRLIRRAEAAKLESAMRVRRDGVGRAS
ncbi:MAG: hypothetical protein ACHREM_08430 [Polyangiales bacterium]